MSARPKQVFFFFSSRFTFESLNEFQVQCIVDTSSENIIDSRGLYKRGTEKYREEEEKKNCKAFMILCVGILRAEKQTVAQ